MNHTLTTLLTIVLTTLAFATRSHAATMGDNKAPVAIPIVESYPSNDAITLRWLKASDDNTPQEKLQYTVQWIKSNRTGAGSEVCTDIDCYTIKGLTPNARYSVQVSVSDESGLTFSYSTMTIATVAGAYDLAVGDVQVTTSNQDDVLGDGTVSFSMQDGHATLTLENAKINATHYGIRAGKFDNGLTIKCYSPNPNKITSEQEAIWVVGDCEITGYHASFTGNAVGRAANKFCGNLTIKNMSNGSLYFYSNNDDAVDMGGNMLTILASTTSFRANGSKGVAIANCGNFVSRAIQQHSGWSYDKNQKKFVHVGGNTEDTYIYTYSNSNSNDGIRIGGVEVTYRNFYDVFGDNGGRKWPEGSVCVYDVSGRPDEVEIYLNNANIETTEKINALDIYTDKYKKVHIYLVGENNIVSGLTGISATHCEEVDIKGPGSLKINAREYGLTVTKNIFLSDSCSLDLYADFFALATDYTSILQIKESSLTLQKGLSVPSYGPMLPICPIITLLGSYIASDHTYQYKDGKTNFYDSNGQIASGGPIVIKAGSGPEPTNKYDVNRDGQVNSADVVAIYNYIIVAADADKTRYDVNDDSQVNAADIVSVYNYIINGN